MKSFAPSVLGIALLLTAATACSSAARQTAAAPVDTVPAATQTLARTLTYKDYTSEFSRAAAMLTWPKAAGMPTAPPTAPDGVSELAVGSGQADAFQVWNCAWGKEYLRTRGSDPAAAAKVLAQFVAIQRSPAWQRAFADPRRQATVRDSVQRATQGDWRAIETLTVSSCHVLPPAG